MEKTKERAEQIHQESTILSNQTSNAIISSIEDDIKRLQNISLLTIKVAQKKSLKQICEKLKSLMYEKALTIMKKRLHKNLKYHREIISNNIEFMSKEKLKTK